MPTEQPHQSVPAQTTTAATSAAARPAHKQALPATATPLTTTPLLEARGLRAGYGAMEVVHGIDLTLHAGHTACLIGANGAGKSTTLGALAGSVAMSAGGLWFDGESIAELAAHHRLRQGIALVPEGRGIFAGLSVEENLRLGAYSRRDSAGIAQDLEHVLERLPRMRERYHQQAGTLSGGEQQMLAIGRALLSRPRLLLLDEPSMGLAPVMVEKVFDLIADIAAEGVTILLVEQNAQLALELADHAWIMESGRIALSGTGASLRQDPRVRAAYLGEGEDWQVQD